MSFDEKQDLDNDGIDLGEIFNSLWFHKFSMLLLITLSVPVFLIYSTTFPPTYTAETVFENPENNSSRSDSAVMGDVGNSFMSFLGPQLGASSSFYSEIRSMSFLKTVVLNNAKLDSKTLRKFCPLPSKKNFGFSLRSLLVQLGVSENKNPSENQKTSLLVKCVNGMLAVNQDSYGSAESSAYKLSITSGDPVFSALLANQIVEKYFVRHEKSRDENFQNVKKYLSEVIGESQLEFDQANELLQSFKIKNSVLMNTTGSPTFNGNPGRLADTVSLINSNPFATELSREISYLSQLEKSLSRLKQVRVHLSNLKELDQEEIKAFLSSTEVQKVISRTFVTFVSKIDGLSVGASFKYQEINKLVSEELQSLEQQMQVLEEKIGKREEQTKKLMIINNRFQELAVDVSKKKILFEGLKDQLKEKILTTGLTKIEQPVLLTKAVPPFRKASPNNKLIVVIGAMLTFMVGCAYILIRQSFLGRIYSVSQLQKLGKSLSCYGLKYKKLKLINEKSNETMISQSFFSRAKEVGPLGCIIDLSQKAQNNSLASTFFKSIASSLATDGNKIVYLDSLQGKKMFFANREKSTIPDRRIQDSQDVLDKHVFTLNDKDGIISAGNIEQIKIKYSGYDKIICGLGTEVGDLIKFKFIEQCDFYILIGKSSQFDENTYKKFAHTNLEKEKKCLGCFLID